MIVTLTPIEESSTLENITGGDPQMMSFIRFLIYSPRFKAGIDKLVNHLRQRDYSPEATAKINGRTYKLMEAKEAMDYARFKEISDEILSIPGALKPEGGKLMGIVLQGHRRIIPYHRTGGA